MKVGTKSVLFGVHAFWFHPITVALAWRKFHGCWPVYGCEWMAIFCHDLGYLGCPDLDGPQGRRHPELGALIAVNALRFAPDYSQNRAAKLILGHSKHYAGMIGMRVSDLYAPDKVCVLYDPPWFYLLRGVLSGEIWEFIENGPKEFRAERTLHNAWRWLNWYRAKVRNQFLPNTNEVQD